VGGGLSLIMRWPRVFGTVYRLTDRRGVDRLMRLPRYGTQRISARGLMRALRQFGPDATVCTHFLPAELLASWRRRGKLDAPLYVALTDFVPHRIWEHAGVDGYFVSSDLAARRLLADGVPRQTIHVTGIPISVEFTRRYNREALKARLDLDATRPLVLVTGGGLGAGSIESIARAALARSPDAQFVFVAGSNAELREQLERIIVGTGWRALGFVSNMHEWLAAADVAIGKAGGLTGAEILASGLPFVVPPGLRGHEDRNAEYLERSGAARVAASVEDAVTAALSIAERPDVREQMRASALRIARPRAAHAIAAIVLRQLGYAASAAPEP
jgi:processive 1,2-diacylglycerol beta-glucosyltransferase